MNGLGKLVCVCWYGKGDSKFCGFGCGFSCLLCRLLVDVRGTFSSEM